jgi:putative ABC transport system substrate-binding protein
MIRREFIALLSGAATAWPLTARAQQRAVKLPTIGFIGPSTASADVTRRAAFAKRLVELSWVDGRNLAIEYRWAEGVVPRASALRSTSAFGEQRTLNIRGLRSAFAQSDIKPPAMTQ